ncbi:MAG: hypothetical protein EHM77_01360 [Planctomycetaceae bacterium]|nr:MAG: hypothetical protein EHM77_01360 [Planctomycetaceae bacterium]
MRRKPRQADRETQASRRSGSHTPRTTATDHRVTCDAMGETCHRAAIRTTATIRMHQATHPTLKQT